MRSSLVILLSLAACKGGDGADTHDPSPASGAVTGKSAASGRPEVQAAAPLPASFPLPDAQHRTLVRSSAKVAMAVWEYEYADLAMDDVMTRLAAALPAAGYTITSSTTDGDGRTMWANHDDRTYVIESRAMGERGTTIAIRAFPESGPTTLPPPATYPAKFPFVAGGTASHAPDGSRLRIAYQTEPEDIELAMVVAARHAGWTCQGSGSVTCTKDGASVTFKAEPAPGGSILVVTTR